MNRKRDKTYNGFYKPFLSADKLSTILQREGKSHRRCILQIESAHTAKCTVINPKDNVEIIEISGRSKCGKTYSEDEVLVKVLQQEGQNEYIPRWGKRIQTEAKTYGEIIGIFVRKRHEAVDHPVLVCELDKFDNDKVKPICKTVPKIQLVSSSDKLGIYEVEIFQYNEKLRTLESKDILKVNPSIRKTYLFFVSIISWNGLYPIGAIIEVHKMNNNPKSGLKILEIQHAVPTIYARKTLEAVENISEETIQHKMKQGRLDLTTLKVFTIDPPNSKDLDDALSIEKLPKGHFRVGVHIADVTSLIEKDDNIDIEAQTRATTFYPGYGCKPYHMIPEPLTNLCSLLPNQLRLTLSFFMAFNHDLKFLPEKVFFYKSIVKSQRKYTYSEVQDIIDDKEGVNEPQFKEEISMLHSIAKELRKRRFGLAVYAFPVENDLYDKIESQDKTFDAHCLVEEFMVLTNSRVADLLISRYPKCVPLRCQDPPLPDKINEWMKFYPMISNLIFHLQGKEPQPNTKLAISNLANKNGHSKSIRFNVVVRFQKWVWNTMTNAIKNGNFSDAYKIFGQDEIHPLQALALDEWYSFQETAKYKCSGNVKGREGKHFSLPYFPFYVHFTSPIRRYADIIAHRLFHAAIEMKESPYLANEVEELCYSITRMGEQAKRFSKKCRALFIGRKIGKEPVMLHGFVKGISDKDIELIFPGLRKLPRQSRIIPLNLLGVCALPKPVKNQDELQSDVEREMVVLKWRRRLYSKTQRPPQPKSKKRGYIHTPPEHGGPFQRIDPHHKTEFQKLFNWMSLINVMCKEQPGSKLQDVLKNLTVKNVYRYIPSTFDTEYDVNSELNRDLHSNSNHTDGQGNANSRSIIKDQFCKYSMSFSHGQVVAIQMTSDFERGVLLPKPQLFDMTGNVKYCMLHNSDPVKVFEQYSTTKSKQNYNSVVEYVQIWLPIILMEAATAATRESPIVINDLPIKFEARGGHFTLDTIFCEERNIDFSSMSFEPYNDESMQRESATDNANKTEYVSCSDYICVRCPISTKTSTFFEPRQNSCPHDFRYWLSHAKIDKTKKVKRNSPEERINVHFTLIPSAPSVPDPLVYSERKFRCSMELIQKAEVDKRVEVYIGRLEGSSVLAKNIALGRKPPKLGLEYMENVTDCDVPLGIIDRNNDLQQKAIEKALKSSFSLIHGPPGTGKTYTGLKLIFLFDRINKRWCENGGSRKQILFCGPSNKSVDLVAKLLLKHFQGFPLDFVRLYGSSLENHDFQIPGRVYSARASSKDSVPDPELRAVSVHHLIRDPEKPYAFKIDSYEKQFRNSSNIDAEAVREYTKLLTKATIEEIAEHDIVLCTTAMATNKRLVEGTKSRVFQCIIDEAGMCTEPECMATIIATRAQQVVLIGDHKQLQPVILNSAAATLGLETSLFERYADRSVQLKCQYRMHPSICEFPSMQFYNNKLRTMNSSSWKEDPSLKIWFLS